MFLNNFIVNLTILFVIKRLYCYLTIGLVLAGALQGAGDTKSPLYSTAIGMWVIRIIGVYVLGIQLEMGIAGVWLLLQLTYMYVPYSYFTNSKQKLIKTTNYFCFKKYCYKL